MSLSIVKISSVTANRLSIFSQIEKIFFQTSSVQTFTTPQLREDFINRWLSPYLKLDSQSSVWVAVDSEQDEILGYLTGHFDTSFYRVAHDHASLSLFADLHLDFPAHLHINMAPGHQGKGVGGALIRAYIEEVRGAGCCGVHLVTSPKARNTSFYRKTGFNVEHLRSTSQNVELLFMGQKLN